MLKEKGGRNRARPCRTVTRCLMRPLKGSEMKLFNLHLRVNPQDLAAILKTTPGATVVSLSSHVVVEHQPRIVKPNGVTGRDFALKYIRDHKSFTSADIAKAFKKDGRNPKSASPCISKLKDDGVLYLKEGIYYRKATVAA